MTSVVIRLAGLLVLFGLATSCTNSNRPSEGGFYSYVDGQGNLVTLKRKPEEKPIATPVESRATTADQRKLLEELDAGSLGEQSEYQTDEEVQRRIDELERDRFITYTDASGYQITQPVDVVAARKAKAEEPTLYRPFTEGISGYVERVEGVPERCCEETLKRADELKLGMEALLSFDRPWAWVSMPERHPATAIKLASGTIALRVQTFFTGRGYLHPQVVFLDKDGVPILLVDNVFTRSYPETWLKHGYLEGELPVEPGSVWAVFYLGYAGESASGRPELVPGEYLWAEPSVPLSLKGELLVRALRMPPDIGPAD
jgi:hypothetical protein